MRLKSIIYNEFATQPQEWHLDKMTFKSRMLLVGKNTAGKSRSLNLTAGLARTLAGQQPPSLSGNYVAEFDNNGKVYIYELHMEEGNILHEKLTIDEKQFLIRGGNGVGKIFAEKIGEKGTDIDFQLPNNSLAAVARRDAIQHKFIEPLFQWADSLRYYQFGNIQQGMLAFYNPGALPVNDRDQNAVVAIFRKGVELFSDEYVASIKNDMSMIDYNVDEIAIAPPISIRLNVQGAFPTLGSSPVSINVKEAGLKGITDQLGMSSGMFRVFALLIHVNYAQFNGSISSILVDDIGEGLDFDRSCRLIELLRFKAEKYDFQLIMSSNDKFVMNHVPLDEWVILQRTGNTVHVRNNENSKAAFEDFEFTGLSNFSFFEMNAVEMDDETHGDEAQDA